jgi:CheY-like chemotaxis protein
VAVNSRFSPVVLLVEDEWLVREEIASAFRDAGWTVLECSTGEGAVGIIESDERLDALLTDIQLGGTLSGWDVADAFHERNPDLPVIYASGNAAEAKRLVSGSRFMSKPCSPSSLVGACGTRIPERAQATARAR